MSSSSSSSSVNRWTDRPFSQSYYETLEKKRKSLPIWSQKNEFLQALKSNQILIVFGETGTGKTTQIPQFVLHSVANDVKKQMIGCTQPRRAKAISASRRVAEELEVNVGEEVGYAIRFEECVSDKTVLKYMTDGVLVREALEDQILEKYSVLIIDEAHERTPGTDALLCILKNVLTKNRGGLRVVVVSEDIDEAEKIRSYFDGAPIFKVPGGVCTEKSFQGGDDIDIPEFDLVNTILALKKKKQGRVDDSISKPETMKRALEILKHIGALDDDGELTDFGELMCQQNNDNN